MNVAVPPYSEYLWPTLVALQRLGGSGTNQEISAAVAEIMGLSPEVQAVLHGRGPQSEVDYRQAWARTYLRMDNAILNSARSVWAITDHGTSLRSEDIPALIRRVRDQSRRAGQDTSSQTLTSDGSVPSETIDSDESQRNDIELTSTVFEEWKEFLLDQLLSMSPDAFERLCQRLLREAGFVQVRVTGRSGDGGIDGIGVLRMALLSFHVLFQSKRYKGTVGPATVRDLRGAMVGRTDKGLLITTGSFTAEAKKEASRDGAPVVELIDGEDLCRLLQQYQLGVTTRDVPEVTVHREWFERI
jgi:restriction system protein